MEERVFMHEHRVFRGEVKMFDISSVLAALLCFASDILFGVHPHQAFGFTALVGLIWMIRSILSLWEKLAVCKAIALKMAKINPEYMAYDRGKGTWRFRTSVDIAFFGYGILCAILTMVRTF
jgi:hypothetical protein